MMNWDSEFGADQDFDAEAPTGKVGKLSPTVKAMIAAGLVAAMSAAGALDASAQTGRHPACTCVTLEEINRSVAEWVSNLIHWMPNEIYQDAHNRVAIELQRNPNLDVMFLPETQFRNAMALNLLDFTADVLRTLYPQVTGARATIARGHMIFRSVPGRFTGPLEHAHVEIESFGKHFPCPVNGPQPGNRYRNLTNPNGLTIQGRRSADPSQLMR